MTDPFSALLGGIGVLALLGAFFWPRHGLFARRRRLRLISSRVAGEDALKHLSSLESEGREASLESVAGALQVPMARASKLLVDMETRGLVSFARGAPRLTPAGREYGLHVLRVHRLWERYLADRTGLHESEWHREAELREHRLDRRAADALSSSLGNPSHDPHGDPIPTASGEIAPVTGQPLPTLEPGAIARIVHIEDEPEETYSLLVAEGLNPGQRIRVTASDEHAIAFLAEDGRERELAPSAAVAVTVVPLSLRREEEPREGEPAPVIGQPLSDARPGQELRIEAISTGCRGGERRRLLDLGFVPGTRVVPLSVGAWGDPTAYRLKGTSIALRREQARKILVKPASRAKEEGEA